MIFFKKQLTHYCSEFIYSRLKNQISSKSNLSLPSNSQLLTNKPSPSNDLSNSDNQPQEGKRKLSLSQYKEHKRLKSSDISDNVSTDVDMRVYAKVRYYLLI